MAASLDSLRVAILAVDGFEQSELEQPRQALQEAGARAELVSAKPGKIRGMRHAEKADAFDVDVTFDQADPGRYDAVLLPGGVVNADAIRMEEGARRFVRSMQEAGKPVAVICHGPWLLVSAGLAQGRTLTSWPSLQDDLRNAGAAWQDREVVVDGNWVSSRKPDDIPAFNRAFIALLAQRRQAGGQGRMAAG